jgi:hypothetical protein
MPDFQAGGAKHQSVDERRRSALQGGQGFQPAMAVGDDEGTGIPPLGTHTRQAPVEVIEVVPELPDMPARPGTLPMAALVIAVHAELFGQERVSQRPVAPLVVGVAVQDEDVGTRPGGHVVLGPQACTVDVEEGFLVMNHGGEGKLSGPRRPRTVP